MTLAPAQYINENVVVVHPDEMARLGALEGDVVMVGHGDEVLRTTVVSARTVKPGLAALPARIRRQISLPEKGQVTVGRPAPRSATPGQAAAAGGVVILRGLRADHDPCLWLAPADAQRFALPPGARLMIQAQPQSPAISDTRLELDPDVPPRSALASQALIDRLDATLGEVLTLKVS